MLIEDISSASLAIPEPFYTSNSRAIISGMGSNTLTGISSTSGGGLFGGNVSSPTISASTGGVVVGSDNYTGSISGTGAVVLGSSFNSTTVAGRGCAIVGSYNSAGSMSSTAWGSVLVGCSAFSGNITVQSNVVVGSSTCSATISGFGGVVVGGTSMNGSLNGTACVVVGSTSNASTHVGAGCVLVGSRTMSGTINGSGCVVVGSFGSLATSPIGVGANGAVIVGGDAMAASGTLTGNGAASIGGSGFNATISGAGSVVMGGSALSSANAGTGCVIVGGQTGGVAMSSGGIGNVAIGGVSNGSITIASGNNGCVVVGGNTAGTGTFSSSNGSVRVGGSGYALAIQGSGHTAIACAGTVGAAATDVNLVLIGGTNTTLRRNGVAGAGTPGSVCIGTSTTAQTFSPSIVQTFFKGNPITATVSAGGITVPVTFTAAQLVAGYVTVTAGGTGNLTFPSATTVYTTAADNSGGAFSHTISFNFFIRNTGGGTITLITGTGFTLQGTTGMIANNATRAGLCVLISATTGFLYLYA
jgi:hypothetical protein